jgi:hypothetical protein
MKTKFNSFRSKEIIKTEFNSLRNREIMKTKFIFLGSSLLRSAFVFYNTVRCIVEKLFIVQEKIMYRNVTSKSTPWSRVVLEMMIII